MRLDERGLIGGLKIGAAGDQNVRACGGADFGGLFAHAAVDLELAV